MAGDIQFDYRQAPGSSTKALTDNRDLQFSRIYPLQRPRPPHRTLDVRVHEKDHEFKLGLTFNSSVLPQHYAAAILERWVDLLKRQSAAFLTST